ncbi:hypothetical protein F0L74_13120 [Chitinophaga agrisoli]|uniref:Uncharacterized protein n=1 Tax=Chitinophaga agrisoli TaxID=2607653 RepID=A0A5B2VUE9_9BACT|nr:hypothetical protein [Chitinophaga agrisoli]KAA2243433.1 hypothetical protein F0L74_13120 [Chitinophaga agrisoli]
MKRSLALSAFLCAFFCLYQFTSAMAASKPATGKPADYSCNYYDALGGKYYCVETSAACNVAHAFVKESGSTASPTLIVLTYQGDSNGCQNYEGSLTLPSGNIIVVHVLSCGCGSSITTHVFFARDLLK